MNVVTNGIFRLYTFPSEDLNISEIFQGIIFSLSVYLSPFPLYPEAVSGWRSYRCLSIRLSTPNRRRRFFCLQFTLTFSVVSQTPKYIVIHSWNFLEFGNHLVRENILWDLEGNIYICLSWRTKDYRFQRIFLCTTYKREQNPTPF